MGLTDDEPRTFTELAAAARDVQTETHRLGDIDVRPDGPTAEAVGWQLERLAAQVAEVCERLERGRHQYVVVVDGPCDLRHLVDSHDDEGTVRPFEDHLAFAVGALVDGLHDDQGRAPVARVVEVLG